jgi:hypothetical protein
MKSVRTVENELLLKHIEKLTDKAWARIEHEAGARATYQSDLRRVVRHRY